MTAKFQKRHYETIAEVLRVRRNRCGPREDWTISTRAVLDSTLDDFIFMLWHDNPNFDAMRFLAAVDPSLKSEVPHVSLW